MNGIARANWITAGILAAYGIAAVIVGVAGSEQPTLMAGLALLVCAVGAMRFRLLFLTAGALTAMFLLGQYVPSAIGAEGYPASTTGILMTVGGVIVAVLAVVALGRRTASTGSC